MAEPHYQHCPGSDQPCIDFDPERMVASCPGCGFTFSTLIAGAVASHYVSTGTDLVVFDVG